MTVSQGARRILILGIFLAIGIVFFAIPQESFAVNIDELKQSIDKKNEEIKKLEEEARKYRDEIASKQQVSQTLKGELSRIEKNISQLKRDINITQKKIQKTQLEIETATLDIRAEEISIEKLRSGLAALFQSLSETEQKSPLEILLENKVLSDFFGHMDNFSLVQKKILDSLDTLRTLQKELKVKKAQAQEKKDELQNLQESLGDRKKIQEDVKQERKQLLKETKNQEKLYQEKLLETEQKQEAILREMEELETELRKRVDTGSLPPQREGFLKWPAEGLLTQGYGETPFTKSRRGREFYKFHNGIDISASIGTPIYAADEGTVKVLGNTDFFCPHGAYGRYIVIDHKNNLTTMYAHLSLFKVGVGEEVKRGDIIGYMGRSGLSTGPHLHFTLYDSRTVEIKLGKIGTCGLLPFGGSINPLLYL